MIDTTGQMVIADSDSGISLYRDNGPRADTRPELNVRKLVTISDLSTLSISDDAVLAITHRDTGYGCGWGSVSTLHPVTDIDVAALTAAKNAKIAARRNRQEADDAAEIGDTKHTTPVCPHCGTYCYGDCRAN